MFVFHCYVLPVATFAKEAKKKKNTERERQCMEARTVAGNLIIGKAVVFLREQCRNSGAIILLGTACMFKRRYSKVAFPL